VQTTSNMFSFRGYGNRFFGFSVEGSNAQIADSADVINFNCSDCSAQNIRVNNIHNSSPNASSIDVQGSHMSLDDVGSVVAASEAGDANALCQVNSATDITWKQIWCSNGWRNLKVANILGQSSGAKVTFVGGGIDECGTSTVNDACTIIVASKDINFFGTSLLAAQNAIPAYALSVDGTSEVRLAGDNLGCYNPGSGCAGAQGQALIELAGAKVWATESQFRSYGASGVGVQAPSTAFFFDLGGNCYGNTIANMGCSGSTGQGFAGGIIPTFPLAVNAITQLGGTQIVNGTAPTCTFTSGGGTTPACAVDTGSTNAAGIIIATTGTGAPASTGTITLTFANTVGTHNPSCIYTASLGGAGQWNARASILDKTPGTATDLTQWDNNGVALATSTAYWIDYGCYGK
jgi:hypothetical protein